MELMGDLSGAWMHDPDQALLEIQRCLHSIGGCPPSSLPTSLEDAANLANGCFLGRWYTEQSEPVLSIPPGSGMFICHVGATLAEKGLLNNPVVAEMVEFLKYAASWPLVSARQSAVFIAAKIISGLGGVEIYDDEIYRMMETPRKRIIQQLVDGCFLGRINLDTVNGENYQPALMQIRDKAVPTRKLIVDELAVWMVSNPCYYFPLCRGLLIHAVNDRVGVIAVLGIQILTRLLPTIVEGEDSNISFLVDFAFMEEVKENLKLRVLEARSENRVRALAKVAIFEYVNSRCERGEPSHLMEDWKDLADSI